MRKVYSKEQRADLIESVLAGRTTVVEAAAKIGVAASTAFVWVRHARRPPSTGSPTFVQLVRSKQGDSGITVHVGGAEVRVQHGFNADVLRAVVSALREAQT